MAAKTADKQLSLKFPPVRANPSKDIFIRMLTKDLSLVDSILDLADNAVDGARRVKKGGTFDGLWIHIEFSDELFRISDNCGGIDIDVAEKYAFCFGRPDDRESESGLIGEFGVGMKRAIFKIGTKFRVESTTSHSHFVVEEDVNEWRDAKKWDFHFQEYEPNRKRVRKDKIGTTIEVTSLYDPISSEFSSTSFRSELERRLQAAHQNAIERGVEIKVGSYRLPEKAITLKTSPKIKPGHYTTSLNGTGEDPIKLRLFAGIANSEPKSAGWYIYCNGRQIVAADQSNKTVWGEMGDDINIPKMHNQFSRFRGYAFFDCDDQGRLPWTTTKQGIDVESSAYKKVRSKMVQMTRPVITFLNRLDQEKDLETAPITEAVSKTKDQPISDIVDERDFDVEKLLADQTGARLARISYQKPADLVDELKGRLEVTKNSEVGEATFDYYCECEEIDVE